MGAVVVEVEEVVVEDDDACHPLVEVKEGVGGSLHELFPLKKL